MQLYSRSYREQAHDSALDVLAPIGYRFCECIAVRSYKIRIKSTRFSRTGGRVGSCLVLNLLSFVFLTSPELRADWVSTLQADNPVHWWRFEAVAVLTGVPNEGSAIGFDGTFGPGITGSDLGQASATPDLGNALEFTGPVAGQFTTRYVDFGAAIPELTHLRPAATPKETSVEFWIRSNHRGSSGDYWWNSPLLFGRDQPANGDIRWGWFNEFGDFGFSTGDNDEVIDRRNGDGSIQVADGQWHHVILIQEWVPAGPSRSTMIVDGGEWADGFSTWNRSPGGDTSYQEADGVIRYFGVQEDAWGTNVQFIGTIDEVAVYDRALSEADARRHYYSAFPDTDTDNMADNYETKYGLVVGVNDGAGDPDLDGLTNLEEFNQLTNPFLEDTDGDGLTDDVETGSGTWTSLSDTGTDPLNPDSDNDGFQDGAERNTGILLGMYDPGTNPNLADSDGDGDADYDEAEYGADPTTASITRQMAPVYSGPPGVWTWELNNLQIIWDHGAGIRDETEFADRQLFTADVGNASELGRPSMHLGARIKGSALTWIFGLNPFSMFIDSKYDSDWTLFTTDLTSEFGFSGKGRRDVSDRLRARLVATEGPGGQSDWSVDIELYNLDQNTLIAGFTDTGTVVNSVQQGTAVYDWWDRDPGEIVLRGHHGVKVWVSPHPLGLHDTDDDGMDDSWEVANFGNLNQNLTSDLDNDGLKDCDEFLAGTNPNLQDTDSDGVLDNVELSQGSDPTQTSDVPPYYNVATPGAGEDLNGNGMSDVWEMWAGTFDLSLTDDDDLDGMSNGAEGIAGTHPLDPSDYLFGDASWTDPNISLAWPAKAYKQYTIEGTEDLSVWTIRSGPAPLRFTVDMTGQLPFLPATGSEDYRVRVEDGDADGDGVGDWSEHKLGSSIEGADMNASRNSLRQSSPTSGGGSIDGDYLAMVERLQDAGSQQGGGGGGGPPPGPGAPSAVQASRFLTQATFGPTLNDIRHVQEIGYDAWIAEQIAETPYLFEPYLIEIWNDYMGPKRDPKYNRPEPELFLFGDNVTTPFMRAATQSNDQLRQRIAFALSQIFVVSRRDASLMNAPRGMANYYDIFIRNAFGNYRDILGEVTYHPCMGRYLSHIGNQKADPGIPRYPDENFAREVMQLLSIGLWELNPDGSRIVVGIDPVPTYSNEEITVFARVFTGLWFPRREWAFGGWFDLDYTAPMEMHAEYHDFDEKILFPDRGLPGRPQVSISARAESAANGILDIEDALDALFDHPNTPPFICSQLIQFLVTANPSGAYVERVQDVFIDNGSGVRGDMGAVIRAILMDDEARNPHYAMQSPSFGKLREPVVRTVALARAFNLGRHENLVWWQWDDYYAATLQEPTLSPSVFNFYRPDYHAPALIEHGLVSPVFQITDSFTSISVPNLIWGLLTEGFSSGPWDFSLDFTDEILLAGDAGALADRMNLLFCRGMMDAQTRTDLILAVEAVSIDQPGSRVAVAAYLALCSPNGAIQR